MKHTKDEVTKRGVSSVAALVIIAVAVYFGFEPLFDLIKETYKIKEEGKVLNYTKLVSAAESGDEDATHEVKKIISEDFIHELTNEELNS